MKNFNKKLTLFVAIAIVASSSVFAENKLATRVLPASHSEVRLQKEVAKISAAFNAAKDGIAQAVAEREAAEAITAAAIDTVAQIPSVDTQVASGRFAYLTDLMKTGTNLMKTGVDRTKSGLAYAYSSLPTMPTMPAMPTFSGIQTGVMNTVSGVKSSAAGKFIVKTSKIVANNASEKQGLIAFASGVALFSYILSKYDASLRASADVAVTAPEVDEKA